MKPAVPYHTARAMLLPADPCAHDLLSGYDRSHGQE